MQQQQPFGFYLVIAQFIHDHAGSTVDEFLVGQLHVHHFIAFHTAKLDNGQGGYYACEVFEKHFQKRYWLYCEMLYLCMETTRLVMANFNVIFLTEAREFLLQLDEKTRNKIIFNIDKAQKNNDSDLFKKLKGEICQREWKIKN